VAFSQRRRFFARIVQLPRGRGHAGSVCSHWLWISSTGYPPQQRPAGNQVLGAKARSAGELGKTERDILAPL
jgi:hypothetical protein